MDTPVWIDIDPLLNTLQEASPPDQTPKSLEIPLKYSDLRDGLMEDGLKDGHGMGGGCRVCKGQSALRKGNP